MIRTIRRLLGFESNSEKVSTLLDIDSRLGEISTEISELAHNYTRRYEAKNEVLKSMSDDFIVTEVTTRFDLFEKSHFNELLLLKKEKDSLEYERLSLLKSKEVSELYQERQKFNIIKSKYKSSEISTELYNIVLKAKEGKVKYSDILVFNKIGELLILKRAKTDESQPEKWGLPGGHVDLGESHLTAAKRELLEETGLNINESELTNIGKFEDKDVCIEYYKAVDVCIESNPIILQSDEHWAYKWINISELDKYDMPFNMKDNIKKVLSVEETEKKTIKSDINDFKSFIEPFLKAFNEGEISAEVLKNVIEKSKIQKIEANKNLIQKSISAFHQGIISEASLKNIIEKARSGRYADTPENQRLKRVGQEYGTKGKEDDKNPKDKKQDEQPTKKDVSVETEKKPIETDKKESKSASDNKEGKEISKKEREKNFKEWFGDSKVVDENGKPLVVYHGTGEKFKVFDPKKIGQNYRESKGGGFFFTSRRKQAENYATLHSGGKGDGEVMESFIKIKNPLTVRLNKDYQLSAADYYDMNHSDLMREVNRSDTREDWGDMYEHERLDGIIIYGKNGDNLYVPLEPNQIKSATDNDGNFDSKSNDITKSEEEQDTLVHEFSGNIDIEKAINTYEKWL